MAFWWALQLASVLEILCWVGAESPSADIYQIQIRSVLFLKSKIKKKKKTGKRTNQSKITTTLSSLCELTVPIWGPRRTMGIVKSRFLFSSGCQKQDEPGALRVQTSPLAESRVSCRPPHGGCLRREPPSAQLRRGSVPSIGTGHIDLEAGLKLQFYPIPCLLHPPQTYSSKQSLEPNQPGRKPRAGSFTFNQVCDLKTNKCFLKTNSVQWFICKIPEV